MKSFLRGLSGLPGFKILSSFPMLNRFRNRLAQLLRARRAAHVGACVDTTRTVSMAFTIALGASLAKMMSIMGPTKSGRWDWRCSWPKYRARCRVPVQSTRDIRAPD